MSLTEIIIHRYAIFKEIYFFLENQKPYNILNHLESSNF
jgi:hypothetical protein